MEMLEREIKYFTAVVEVMRLTGVPSHFYNHYPQETMIVVKNILTCAESTGDPLRIFASDFYELYYGEIYDKLVELAKKGHDIQIILADRPKDSDLDKWRIICENDNVKVSFMPEYDPTMNHVWLTGNTYRYELPHERFTGEVTNLYPERPARFAFNNESEVKKAEQAWDKALHSHRQLLRDTN